MSDKKLVSRAKPLAKPAPPRAGSSSLQQQPSEARSGQQLLSVLHELPKPLTEVQVGRIADHLNAQPHADHTAGAFRSEDLQLPNQELIDSDNQAHGAGGSGREAAAEPPAVERFDAMIQHDAFDFVRSDVQIELRCKHSQPWIAVGGLRRRTTIAFLYVYFNFLLVELWNDLHAHPERHMPEQSSCKSSFGSIIVCPCIPEGVTARLGLTPRLGASLILVPKRLLASWKQEWRVIGITAMHLFIQHREFSKESVSYHRRRELLLKMVSGEYKDAITELHPNSKAHNIIILTTMGSYWRKVQYHFRNWRPLKPASGPSWSVPLPYGDRTDGIAWGRIVHDEAHLDTLKAPRFLEIMASLASNGWTSPNYVAVTATPMLRHGPGDMQSLAKVINMMSPDIHKHPDCAGFAKEGVIKQLCQDHSYLRRQQHRGVATEDTVSNVRARVGAFFAAYCIQRRGSSILNGKSLLELPPLEVYHVHCPSGVQYSRYCVWQVEEFLKDNFRGVLDDETELDIAQFLAKCFKARILADVPDLARYGDLDILKWGRIQEQGWHIKPEESPFAKDLAKLEAGSGKLQTLRLIISRLGVSASGTREKLVVVSEFPIVCLLVLVLCSTIPGLKCEWMHSRLVAEEREWLASNFQESRVLDPGEQTIDVLVGTVRILGTGLTLHKAIRLVLMEPSRSAEVQTQISKRIHRIGVTTDRCWFYVLLNPDSDVERAIIKDHLTEIENHRVAAWFTRQTRPEQAKLKKEDVTVLRAYATWESGDEDAYEPFSDDDAGIPDAEGDDAYRSLSDDEASIEGS